MKHLSLLIKKDLRLLLRSKGSALIVIFAPLLIILLLGLSYNTSSTFGLTVGIHSDTLNEEVTAFAQSLQAQDFTIITYEDVNLCVDDIKFNSVHACLSLPSNFDIGDNTPKEVTFYLDQSRINLVWIIQQALEAEFNLKSSELSQIIVDDILVKIDSTKQEISVQGSTINSLVSTSQSAIDTTNTISSRLNQIELSPPTLTQDDTLLTATLDSFSTALNVSIKDIQTTLLILENVSGSSEAQVVLSDALSNLESTNLQMAGSGAGTVADAIATFEAELDLVNEQLLFASNTIGTVVTENLEVSSSLGSTTESLLQAAQKLDEIKASLGTLLVSDAGTISTPLVTKIKKISAERTNLNYAFPSLLALIVMFFAIMLGNTLVMMEKTSPAYVRNFMIPVKKIVFVLATLLSNIIIIIFQLILILLIALAFIPEAYVTFPLLFITLLLAGFIFALIGMLIGYLFSSEETGILASISTGSVFLFLSGLILPIEGMSAGLRALTSYNPFVMTERIIRKVFIFETPFLEVSGDLFMMLTYIVILFLIVLVVDSLLHKHLVHQVVFRHHKRSREEASKKGKAH